jgi:hypothetical protein
MEQISDTLNGGGQAKEFLSLDRYTFSVLIAAIIVQSKNI